MSAELSLRAATEADAGAVLAMVRAQAREEQPDLPFSPARVRGQFDACLDRGAVVVSTEGDTAVATCAMLPETAPFSDAEWLRVLWCFVRIEHRRVPHMRELLRAVRAIGAAAGRPVRLDCAGGPQLQGKLGLFRRELGDSAGVTFLIRS